MRGRKEERALGPVASDGSQLTRRSVLAGGAAAAGLAVIGAPRIAKAAAVAWIGASATPQTDFIAREVDFFAQRVHDLTKGQMTIETHHGGSLGGERDHLESILQGAMHVASPGQALMAGWYKPAEIWTFPYVFKDLDHKDRVWNAIRDDYAADMVKRAKFRPVGGIPRMPRMLSCNRVVQMTADMKGLKIRVPETPMWRKTFERFGASPTPLPFPEVFTSLKSGVIDGQENPIALTWTSGVFDVNTHLNLTEHMIQDNVLIVGEAALQKLPADLRDAVLKAGREAEEHFGPIVRKDDADTMSKIKEKRIVVTEVDKESFRAAVKGMEAEFPNIKTWHERISTIA